MLKTSWDSVDNGLLVQNETIKNYKLPITYTKHLNK